MTPRTLQQARRDKQDAQPRVQRVAMPYIRTERSRRQAKPYTTGQARQGTPKPEATYIRCIRTQADRPSPHQVLSIIARNAPPDSRHHSNSSSSDGFRCLGLFRDYFLMVFFSYDHMRSTISPSTPTRDNQNVHSFNAIRTIFCHRPNCQRESAKVEQPSHERLSKY